ncbi:MAG: class I SAM-dependent methyltransferase [Alphaproteobacteria bacterium]|nr:class I SAM-dependent methyltransferase [Alphaproteobacteria bacterium]MBF0332061.1 class I SAM-dependent methyltransferase [Alphaproteobacteria bacterium]
MKGQLLSDPRIIQIGREKYQLDYHAIHASIAELEIGLAGKTVLEVGGNLPPGFALEDLKAERWVAVQEPSYWQEIGGKWRNEARVLPIEECPPVDQMDRYTVLLGQIEKLPPARFGSFDRIFSVAAFEHIHELGLALRIMRRALAAEGALYAMFAPIWSSPQGHHLPDVTDESGRTFSFSNAPIPSWGHLLMRPPEMFQHLLAHTDERTASRICYFVYHSPHINRLFYEDYTNYARLAGFSGFTASFLPGPVPDDVRRQLETLHPGRTQFAAQGMVMVFR